MEARNRGLPDWITKVRTRQIVLPRFQRMEAWGYREVTDLLQTVLQGLPAGAVLILEVGDEQPFVCRPLEGAPTSGERITELLLDGQQRLTALWKGLTNGYGSRSFFVEVPDPGTGAEPQAISVSRWVRASKRYPLWADSPAQCWERRLVPFDLLMPDTDAETRMDKWIAEVSGDDTVLDKMLTRQIDKLRQQVAAFNLPFLSLPVGTPRDVVLDVFVKLNTRSVRLTAFDIVVAQTEEAAGESLHDLVAGLAASVPGLPDYDAAQDIALNVMALLQDRAPNQTGYLGLDVRRMVDEWSVLVGGARRAVALLEEEGIFDAPRLPTESVLAPLIALWAQVPDRPDEQGNARILLRRYLWSAFLTDRYERAAATAALQDYRALRSVIAGKGDTSDVRCFDREAHPLPTVDELVQAGWPKKRDRLARAVLALSLRGGARDIADGQPIGREHIRRREYHHLFPVAFLEGRGVADNEASKALNCALISWRTNRTISAKEPLRYLLERAEASTLGKDEIERRLASHGVPFESLVAGDYSDFLVSRAEMMLEGAEVVVEGRGWSPATG